MNVIIAWYSLNRVPFVIPKRRFQRLIDARMVCWTADRGEWSILCSAVNVREIAGGEPMYSDAGPRDIRGALDLRDDWWRYAKLVKLLVKSGKSQADAAILAHNVLHTFGAKYPPKP